MNRIIALGMLAGTIIGLSSFAVATPAQAYDNHWRNWEWHHRYVAPAYAPVVNPVYSPYIAPVTYNPYAFPSKYNPYNGRKLTYAQRVRMAMGY